MTEFVVQALALLRSIDARLAELARTQKRGRAPARALSAEDRRALAIALPAIRESIGGNYFTTKDLFERAAGDALLQAKLAQAFRHECGNGRAAGKFLARAEGFAVEGLVLERGEPVREGMLWTVCVFETRANPQTRGGACVRERPFLD